MIIEYTFLASYFLLEIILFWVAPVTHIRLTLFLYFLAYYILWSVLHQLRIQKFTLAVMLEYILVGALLLVLLKVLYFPQL
ncbi:MAG: hypothetical protein AAB893_03870 [Patescibacteria group bacterium]